jgi:ABC-type glycerol-3-phosphate transport system substrate-binding protein
MGRGQGRRRLHLLLYPQAMKGSAERPLLSRRRFLELGGAGLAGAALLGVAGCARQESKGLVRLVFSHGEDSEVLRDQIQRFNQRNKGAIEVALRLAPADTDQYFEKLRIEFQAGEAEADIISGDVIWPAQFAAKGWISDLSDLFTADLRASYLPATVDSNTYEGRIYGVPWFTDAGLLYYRQDLLEQAGFSDTPKTWDEMKEMVAKVRRDRGTRYGFVFQGSEYEGGVVNGLEFIWNSGGGVLAPHGIDKVIVAAPEAVAGLKTARGMVTGRVAPVAVPSYKEYESYTVFLNGDAVFMRNWPNVYARGRPFSLEGGTGAHRGRAAPCGAPGEPSSQRPRRLEPDGQHRLREDGGRLGLYPVPERPRTAEREGIEGRLPADAQRLLRGRGDPLSGAGHRAGQGGYPRRALAPGHTSLPRHVPGDGRTVPRLARGDGRPRTRRRNPPGEAPGDPRAIRFSLTGLAILHQTGAPDPEITGSGR